MNLIEFDNNRLLYRSKSDYSKIAADDGLIL